MKNVIADLHALQALEFRARKGAAEKTTIQELRQAIPSSILAHYDRLQERGKKGVALVKNGVCSECHMRVPIGVVATLMHRSDIQLCGNCGRYLVLAEGETVVPVLTEPKSSSKKKKSASANVYAE